LTDSESKAVKEGINVKLATDGGEADAGKLNENGVSK
jgi:hypothetical protein